MQIIHETKRVARKNKRKILKQRVSFVCLRFACGILGKKLRFVWIFFMNNKKVQIEEKTRFITLFNFSRNFAFIL